MARDDETVKEIRETFEAYENEWADIRKEGALDVRALTPLGTWPDADRKQRKDASRPCLSLDELNQYVNQLVNDARSSKRAIECDPGDALAPQEGFAAPDVLARFAGNHIRQIEYRSNASTAYTTMFQNAVERSYGFLRVNTRHIEETVDQPTAASFNQDLWIEPIPNPDLVTPDPWALSQNFSDQKGCFIRESFSEAEFKRRWPKADVKDFGGDAVRTAGARWIGGGRVWVAEYWKVDTRPKKLVLLTVPGVEGQPEPEPMAVWRDTIPADQWAEVKARVLRERTVDQPYVCQKITNGLEVLETLDWPGQYIPIVGCLGKVLWLTEGGKTTRYILSLIRLARDPQQLYNYMRTGEAELVGMTPKVPYFAYEGSLSKTMKAALALSNQEPVGVIEVKASIEGMQGPPPFPSRNAYDPAIQAFEIGAESARRAIQAAMGSGFLPTDAQRQNQKSGIALEKITTSAQKGSFHFIDNYEDSVRQVGVVLADLLPHILDTARDVFVREPDGKTTTKVRINDPAAPPAKNYEKPITTKGLSLAIRLSTGPSYDSERERSSDFADQLVGVRPEIFAALGPLIIKLKNLGPVGDEMVKVLEVLQPPAVQALRKEGQAPNPEVQQLQAQLQQATQAIEQLQKMLETDQVKAAGAVKLAELKAQAQLALEQLKGQQKIEQLAIEQEFAEADREDSQRHDLGMKAAEAHHSASQAERAAALRPMHPPTG